MITKLVIGGVILFLWMMSGMAAMWMSQATTGRSFSLFQSVAIYIAAPFIIAWVSTGSIRKKWSKRHGESHKDVGLSAGEKTRE